jgi:hypothetical protein
VGNGAQGFSEQRLPIVFERNRGQTDSRVQFLARGSGYTLFLGPDAVTAVIRGAARGSTDSNNTLDRQDYATVGGPPTAEQGSTEPPTPFRAVRMQFVGSNDETTFEGREPTGGISNYFIGTDPDEWRTDIPHYRCVTYHDVYPGANVVYYGAGRNLEYDFVVEPGADPSHIALRSVAQDNRLSMRAATSAFPTLNGCSRCARPSCIRRSMARS